MSVSRIYKLIPSSLLKYKPDGHPRRMVAHCPNPRLDCGPVCATEVTHTCPLALQNSVKRNSRFTEPCKYIKEKVKSVCVLSPPYVEWSPLPRNPVYTWSVPQAMTNYVYFGKQTHIWVNGPYFTPGKSDTISDCNKYGQNWHNGATRFRTIC